MTTLMERWRSWESMEGASLEVTFIEHLLDEGMAWGNLYSLMPNNPGNKYITLKRKKLRFRNVKSLSTKICWAKATLFRFLSQWNQMAYGFFPLDLFQYIILYILELKSFSSFQFYWDIIGIQHWRSFKAYSIVI